MFVRDPEAEGPVGKTAPAEVPRRDVAVDAAYAEAYYAPFTSTCLELMTGDDRFRPYVSDSPYARGCLAPSGVRVFFDGADQCRRVGAYVATDL